MEEKNIVLRGGGGGGGGGGEGLGASVVWMGGASGRILT